MTPKHAWMITTASLLMFVFGPLRADTTTPPQVQPALNITGTIQSLDLTNNTVVINDAVGNRHDATIDKTASVYRGGSAVPFSDLKVGDRVSVQLPNPATVPTTPPAQ